MNKIVHVSIGSLEEDDLAASQPANPSAVEVVDVDVLTVTQGLVAVSAADSALRLAGCSQLTMAGQSSDVAFQFVPSMVMNLVAPDAACYGQTYSSPVTPTGNDRGALEADLANEVAVLANKMTSSLQHLQALADKSDAGLQHLQARADKSDAGLQHLQARADKSDAQMVLNSTRIKNATLRVERLERKHGVVIITADRCNSSFMNNNVAKICWELGIRFDKPKFKNGSIKVPLLSEADQATFVEATSRIRQLFGSRSYVKKDAPQHDEARHRAFETIRCRMLERKPNWASSQYFHSDGDKLFYKKQVVAIWIDDTPEVVDYWKC